MSRPLAPGWLRALRFTRGHGFAISLLVLFTLCVGALGALEPLVLKNVFDAAGAGKLEKLTLLVAALFGLGLARETFSGLSNWLSWRTRLRVHHALLDATVSRLHTLPVAYHRQHPVGRIMTKLDRGIQGFVGAITDFTFTVFPSIVYLVVAIGVMVELDVRLALAVLFFVPIPAIISAKAAPEQMRRERTLLDRWSSIYSRFNEVLHGIVTVKSFAMEDEEKRRFLRDVDSANGVVVRGVARDTWISASKNLVTVAASASAIGVGTFLVTRGEISIGTVVAFLGYLHGLFGPVQGLTSTYQTMRKASVSLETVFEILDHPDLLGDAPDAVELTRVRGDVELRGVSFSYGSATNVLENIDLSVKAGEVIAMVGPSGGGKSTMMALLQRLYDPNSGEVRIDGIDLKRVKQRSLRQNIGVVLQEPLLFDDTISANIAYGRPDATFREIVEAATMANAHEFISRLPHGYRTRAGERGALLSAGQRQRIAIARALLKDPRILILDEATSALDAESEALVQDAIDRVMRGRTTFIIAHRLATVCGADRILVLANGRIVEQGTHAELLAARGYYAKLVDKQTRGLLVAA